MNPMFGGRRLVAVLIDFLIASAFVTALLVPLVQASADRIRLSVALPDLFRTSMVEQRNGVATVTVRGMWESADCVVPQQASEVLFVPIAPVEPDNVLICQRYAYGIPNGAVAEVTYGTRQDGNLTTSRSYAVPVDAGGTPVRPLYPQGLLVALVLLLVGALGIRFFGGRTPGKWLTGIKVASNGGTCPLCREVRRMGPFLLMGLHALIKGMFPLAFAANPLWSWAGIGLGLAFWSFAFWYYAVPFLSRHGLTRYDDATGYRVTR